MKRRAGLFAVSRIGALRKQPRPSVSPWRCRRREAENGPAGPPVGTRNKFLKIFPFGWAVLPILHFERLEIAVDRTGSYSSVTN